MGYHKHSYRSRSRTSTHRETTDGTPQTEDPELVTPTGSPVTGALWAGDHKWETTDGRRQMGDSSPRFRFRSQASTHWETTDGRSQTGDLRHSLTRLGADSLGLQILELGGYSLRATDFGAGRPLTRLGGHSLGG